MVIVLAISVHVQRSYEYVSLLRTYICLQDILYIEREFVFKQCHFITSDLKKTSNIVLFNVFDFFSGVKFNFSKFTLPQYITRIQFY